MAITQEKLLQVENLKKYFESTSGILNTHKSSLKAVDDVSLHIFKGETLGLVGESGCGKTTIGRTIVKLYESSGGKILYAGKDITKLSETQMLPYRKRMQMIFQDPYASLNSRMTVGDIIGESIDIHKIATGNERTKLVQELLHKVGLNAEHVNRYPHEFSGGQRQRIGIARSLAVQPEFIVCDEPISALDVSIQAQIINLLEDLQDELGLTYLFIAHDLSMVKHISNRVGVMYLGKLVELAPSRDLYIKPLHPYTKALLSAIPVPDPEVAHKKQRIVLEGDVPSPMNPPSGCRFRTRCKFAKEICSESTPVMEELAVGHFVACHRVKEIN